MSELLEMLALLRELGRELRKAALCRLLGHDLHVVVLTEAEGPICMQAHCKRCPYESKVWKAGGRWQVR